MENEKKFIISINTHDINLLTDQLKNIKQFLKFKYIVILNCNVELYDIVKNKNFNNVHINPVHFDKSRFHGSLFKGIYENLKLALENYEFEYYLTLSARSIFNQALSKTNLDHFLHINKSYTVSKKIQRKNGGLVNLWGEFSKCKFYRFILDNKLNIKHEMHEGFIFTSHQAFEIQKFFNKNKDLLDSVYHTNTAMEELVIPTLLFNWFGYTQCLGLWPGCEKLPWAKNKIIHKKY